MNALIAKARDRIHRDLTHMDLRAEENIRKVQPIIQNGLLSLAVMDPKVVNRLIDVSVWVEGNAEELRGRLLTEARAGVDGLSHAAHVGVADLSVAVGTLDTNARKVLQGLRISSQQAGQLMRTSFNGLRGVAGSWELLLALGSLYLINDSLEKNLKKAEAETGVVSSAYLTPAGKANMGRAAAVGVTLARTGALIGAVAGFYDAAQMGLATKRTILSGDAAAANRYAISAIVYVLSASASIFAISTAMLFGPIGVAIGLAIAAYSIAKLAEKNESTPLERWARRCFFGKANERPVIHWNTFNHADIAFAELNAATLGLIAQAEFRKEVLDPVLLSKVGCIEALARPTPLFFRVVLPQFNEHISAYQWSLAVHRHGDGLAPNYKGGEIVNSGEFYPLPHSNTASMKNRLAPRSPPRRPDYNPEKSKLKQTKHYLAADGKSEDSYTQLNGSIELINPMGRHSIEAATLAVAYWPDRELSDGYAEITLQVPNE